ncbi:suppressor protein SRP40-like [Diprion similis]|uniref:suppressor protein SRP40-like n=1 Tax=Diprion similis TaxID=362088 RepID=UPI001EF85E8A|nr:suppressor protein SRP40-like [Diprion similis]
MSSSSRVKSKNALKSPRKTGNEETSAAPGAVDDKKTQKDVKKEGEAKKLNSIDNNNTQCDARATEVSNVQAKLSKKMNDVCGELQRIKIEDGGEPQPMKEATEKKSDVEETTQKNVDAAYQVKTKEQKKKERETERLAKAMTKFSKKFVSAAKDLGIIEQNQDYSSDSDISLLLTDSSLCSSSCTCSECCTTDSSTCSCSDCCSDGRSSSTSYSAGSSTTDSSSESSSESSPSSP